MNGDLGKIYKAINEVDKKIVAIQTEQKIRHEENQKYMKILDELPCDKNVVMVESISTQVKALWVLVVSVIIIGIMLK